MSVKRLALFAALSQHNNNHQNNPNTTTTTMTMTTLKSPLQQQRLQKSSTTAPSTLTVGTIDSSSSRSSNNNNNTTSSIMTTGSAITTYYSGGLGLFHQQNIRANSGGVGGGGGGGSGIGIGGGSLGLMNSGSGNGAGSNNFPNAINGNVNLLLGGAMLSLVTTILCVVCYCCHRNIKKRTEAAYRQQRQWLENDPNMEIYSVEQCYETSGLFLGESNDGLATLPALHHEPPPSYDAVVAMQEQQLLQQQQQQQQLMLLELEHHHHHQLQSNSPPPGYRSSLDVSAATATMVGATMVAGCSRGAPDGMAISDSNGNLNGQQKTLNGVSTMMNMKNVLSAQSCCSLQRAEVENMWNAAAAAVAARAAHTNAVASATSQEQVAISAMRTPTTIMKRKTLPAYAGAKLSVNEFGRRYLNQNYYRRGCPLCGKFCYNDEGENEGALSLSTESLRLDNLATPTTTELATVAGRRTNNNMLTRQFCHRNDCDNNGNDGDFEDVESREMTQTHIDDNRRHHNSETNRVGNSPKASASSFNVGNSPANYDYDDDENDSKTCTCNSNRRDTSRRQCETIPTGASNRYDTQEQQQPDDNANDKNDDENGNDHLVPAQQLGLVASLSENEMSDFVANFDGNEAILPITDADNNNVNPTISATSTSISEDTDITPTTTTLDSINENGIIRLDMSKIIDRTGLPNYEAALKLESSGYV